LGKRLTDKANISQKFNFILNLLGKKLGFKVVFEQIEIHSS
jgi:hypothetical protein